MSNTKITDWERRARRRVAITVAVSVSLILILAGGLIYKLTRPYETWNLTDFYNKTYTGFNTEGKIHITLNETKLNDALNTLKNDYKDSVFHLNSCTDSDYEAFKQSMSVSLLNENGLSNGSTVVITCNYDKDIAKKLNLNISEYTEAITVTGLVDARRLTMEDLFKDLSVSYSGISPNVTVDILNQSSDPFIQTVEFSVLESQKYYCDGDTITIQAVYSEADATNRLCSIDTPSDECLKSYTVSSESAYILDSSKLPESILKEAVSAGLNAFTDANEYGVRIFCEAGLVPVYINKQATFEWVNPTFKSAYLKCIKDEYIGNPGYHYNDLDIVYSTVITQANGVSCNCYAVVRFSDIIINSDGTLTYDFSGPKIMSSDYRVNNIHNTVVTSFEDTHTVTKL